MKKAEILHISILLTAVFLTFRLEVSGQHAADVREPAKSPVAQTDSLRTAAEILDYLTAERTRGLGTLHVQANPLRLAIAFDFNDASLKREAKCQLDELGKALQSAELANTRLELAGHTDSRGSEQYNLTLSNNRVATAKKYLVSTYKIEGMRIHAVGYVLADLRQPF